MAVEWKNYSGRYKQVYGAFIQSRKLLMSFLYHKGTSVRKTKNADLIFFNFSLFKKKTSKSSH